ncbi:SDR family NAD(P)-dependent oxidoreductase [Amycolatopsis thermoflava]|uniref:SDR family NAD(P)-dependent oxidoreductase n=1 Tax=Amycolatopsis thermoflava TaxID=84480 RepID=UPI000413B9EC|nr:SDR family NAD(P)-dependent oxidoreductase [Amycolatopsis thermoflava]
MTGATVCCSPSISSYAGQQRRHHRIRQVDPADAHDQIPSTVDLDMVRAVFETDLFGVIAVTMLVLPLLRKSPAPRIVNVSSHAASLALTSDPDGPFAALLPSAAYSPSKTALCALTVQYANELRKDGVLVNAVAPGYVGTDSNNYTGFLTVAQGGAAGHARPGRTDGRLLRRGRTAAVVDRVVVDRAEEFHELWPRSTWCARPGSGGRSTSGRGSWSRCWPPTCR